MSYPSLSPPIICSQSWTSWLTTIEISPISPFWSVSAVCVAKTSRRSSRTKSASKSANWRKQSKNIQRVPSIPMNWDNRFDRCWWITFKGCPSTLWMRTNNCKSKINWWRERWKWVTSLWWTKGEYEVKRNDGLVSIEICIDIDTKSIGSTWILHESNFFHSETLTSDERVFFTL